jgi:hypothetical protein
MEYIGFIYPLKPQNKLRKFMKNWLASNLSLSPSPLAQSHKFISSHLINRREPLVLWCLNRFNTTAAMQKKTEGFHEDLTQLHPILSPAPPKNLPNLQLPI